MVYGVSASELSCDGGTDFTDYPPLNSIKSSVHDAPSCVFMPAATERMSQCREVNTSFGTQAYFVLGCRRLPEQDRNFHSFYRAHEIDKIISVLTRRTGLPVQFIGNHNPGDPSVLALLHSGKNAAEQLQALIRE